MPTRFFRSLITPWFIAIICIVISLATIYAILPFVPLSNSATYPAIDLPYRSKNSNNLLIQLPHRILNPHITPNEPIDDRLGAKHLEIKDQTLFLIQYKTPITPDNLSIITAFPTNTYLIRSTLAQVNQLAQDSQINFIDHYAPEYKLAESLITDLPIQKSSKEIKLKITVDPAQNQDILFQKIIALDPNVQIDNEPNNLILPNFNLIINTNKLIDLAQLPQIILIEPGE